jgi:heme A synthase
MRKFVFRMLAGIVLLNVTMVVGALVARRRLPTYGDQDSDTFALVAAMDGVDFASRADALAAGSGTAVAGGIEIDLTEASLADTATLVLTAVMGGIDVVVPQEWRVEMSSSVFMGGTDNLTDPDATADDAPLLLVDARAYLGGIAVRPETASDQ